MDKDTEDFYEKIRQINRRNAANATTQEDITNELEAPAAPRKFSERLLEYVPGLVLIAWTVLPLSLTLAFAESTWPVWCMYPVFSPLVWIAIAGAKPDKAGITVIMGIIGHVMLSGSIWYIVENSGGLGNSVYVGFEVYGVLIILGLLVYSFLGSIVTILFAAHFFSTKPAQQQG